MTSGIDRECRFARRIPGSGTNACLESWCLQRTAGLHEAGVGAERVAWRSAVEMHWGKKVLSAPALKGGRLATNSVSRAGENRPVIGRAARYVS